MKTIESRQISSIESNNGKHIETITLWNVHYQYGNVAENKRSNGYKFIANYFKNNKKAKKVCAMVAAKGRSQHSASQLVMFDITDMSENDIEESCIEESDGYTNTFDTKDF